MNQLGINYIGNVQYRNNELWKGLVPLQPLLAILGECLKWLITIGLAVTKWWEANQMAKGRQKDEEQDAYARETNGGENHDYGVGGETEVKGS